MCGCALFLSQVASYWKHREFLIIPFMNGGAFAKRLTLKRLATIALPSLAVAAIAVATFRSREVAFNGQIPIAIKSSQSDWEHYKTYTKPNGRLLSSAPWMITLESGSQQKRDLVVCKK